MEHESRRHSADFDKTVQRPVVTVSIRKLKTEISGHESEDMEGPPGAEANHLLYFIFESILRALLLVLVILYLGFGTSSARIDFVSSFGEPERVLLSRIEESFHAWHSDQNVSNIVAMQSSILTGLLIASLTRDTWKDNVEYRALRKVLLWVNTWNIALGILTGSLKNPTKVTCLMNCALILVVCLFAHSQLRDNQHFQQSIRGKQSARAQVTIRRADILWRSFCNESYPDKHSQREEAFEPAEAPYLFPNIFNHAHHTFTGYSIIFILHFLNTVVIGLILFAAAHLPGSFFSLTYLVNLLQAGPVLALAGVVLNAGLMAVMRHRPSLFASDHRANVKSTGLIGKIRQYALGSMKVGLIGYAVSIFFSVLAVSLGRSGAFELPAPVLLAIITSLGLLSLSDLLRRSRRFLLLTYCSLRHG